MSLKETMQRNFHNLIIAETGGGKTLCYALPMIEYSIRVKHQLKKMNIQRERNQPIGLVLVPTRELAFQVYETFKKLVANDNQVPSEENKTYLECLNDLNVAIDLHASQIKAKEDISNTKIDSLGSTSEIPVDILITTPGQLEDRLYSKYLNSAYLRNMVVDEADTLFDDSFSEVTLKCLNKLQLNLTLPQIKIETNSNSEGEENFDG
jgi:superfamily II DNA/RNA helicase